MLDFFASTYFWWTVAAIVISVEIIIPTGFELILISISAAIVAVLSSVVDMPLVYEFVVFGAATMAVLIYAWMRRVKLPQDAEQVGVSLNNRTGNLIGVEFKLIENTNDYLQGKIKAYDTVWIVQVDKQAIIGDTIKITSSNGVILHGLIV